MRCTRNARRMLRLMSSLRLNLRGHLDTVLLRSDGRPLLVSEDSCHRQAISRFDRWLVSGMAVLRSPLWHRIGVAHALGVFQICAPKVNERRRTHEVIPPHLSVRNLLCGSNNCDPENKIRGVRNQVREKESPRKAHGMGLNKPQSQPRHETQRPPRHKRINTQ